MDTLDVRPLLGVILKHFSSYDVVSRWNVLAIYSRATAATASLFLDDMVERTPNEIKAIQIDEGGLPPPKESSIDVRLEIRKGVNHGQEVAFSGAGNQ